jgi:PAS domain S-box-containing protein
MDKLKFESLQQRAQEKLQGNKKFRNLDGKALSRQEINDAFHNLQVYQVELEIQNEELINTQQQLMEMSEQYRNLYNAAPIGYLTISLEGLITQCNETFLQMFGLTRDEALNRSISNWIVQCDSNTYYDYRKKLINSAHQQVFNLRLHRKNRTEIYAKVTLKLNELGNRKIILMTLQDETEMFNIQDAYQNLVENSAQGLWLFQEEELVFANNRACEIFGCYPEEYMGKTVHDLFSLIDSSHWQRFVKLFDSGETYVHKIEPMVVGVKNKKSGRYLWLEFFISHSKYRGNNALQLAFTDITDKVAADEKVKKSEMLFKTSSQLASDSIYQIILPEKQLLLLASGLQYKKYRYDFSKMDLETYFNSIDIEYRDKMIEKHNALINHGISFEETYPMQLPTGEKIFIHDRATVLEWENKKPKSIIGVTTDMTQIFEKEKQLTALNATKDKFFSIIAHDLKNPFNSLIGFTDLLGENYDVMSDEERRNIIQILAATAGSGFKLLENLLNWSRLQTNRIEYIPGKINLFDVTENVIEFMKPSANQKQIILKNLIPADAIVFADNNIVETILRNLISNAVKFTPEKGSVVVDATADDKKYTISVRDTGKGIDKEKLVNLFKVENVDSTPGTASERGTGLGLVLCSDFVKMEGGKIWIESKIDKGTSVYLTLKKCPAEAVE